MLKKMVSVAAATAAGMVMLGGMASATTGAPADHHHHDDVVGNDQSVDQSDFAQVGLVNLNNTQALQNVNAVVGACDNNINVLGVQVPIEDVANGIDVPVLSPGSNEADSVSPDICGSGGIVSGGTGQSN
ncbi:hypothetical protein ACFFQW_18945 [Umezawaea endophytica]|uniref:Small secreted domain DUF320 n=1 Tax=Umezawaea endophytica TaxID=1654476 RepID=A0A9X2VNB4_9PSEU|nr:hypothetical protein [Umezawaea endophytica]MCS7479856.1 hypothetical protein [Umezawaea endophytica]